ncbi:VanW family protein [Bacillus solimangrovi]|uniref:Peptidoglycan binding domain-containing protein n=1 Tax=Bacillus solimangrovi TaxID=1305675 RepID=A0A1E5LBU8_9BACI|nr:VanW family protein [Bacillus solimangrovi]OEH91561.1 hypothetical protein BFG57_04080 [Bacillus solimangrovi]
MKLLGLTLFFMFANQLSVQAHLTITYDEKPLISINRQSFFTSVLGNDTFDYELYKQFENKLEKMAYKEPVNAKINNQNEIIQGETGTILNRKKLNEQFHAYYFGKGPATIELPIYLINPKVDSELLANIRTNLIGQYITYYNSYNKERSHNIFLAAQAINNHVVFPNEEFSFNQVVGKRTKEKGYMPAPEIVRGEMIEGIGGGICQVSSTLYNAVDHAGVQIVKRYSHSKRVPYVPLGRDATVSWYGPDFAFKNIYNQPILIRAFAQHGRMIIKVFSSDDIDIQTSEDS